MNSGIYLILQNSTGRHYIGSAVQLERRWDRHRADLKAERHHNQKLQRAWLKYGENDFEFQIIERCVEDRLIEREQYWLDQTMPFFNVLRKAYSAAGYKHSEEARAKMAEVARRTWESMSPEQREEKARRHAETITGLRHTEETKQRMSETHKGIQRTPEQLANLKNGRTPEARAKQAESRAGTYIVTSPEGEEIAVKNLSAFCREHGLIQAHMNAIAKGRRNIHKGWLCRYDMPKPEVRE